LSSKRWKGKRIKRIIDDAELGEETKKKIAIEKVILHLHVLTKIFLLELLSILNIESR